MKNLVVYYIAIFAPFLILFWLVKTENTHWFVIGLLLYAFPYRTYIDGQRLVSKKLMKWSEWWKLLLPGTRINYTRELYFRK